MAQGHPSNQGMPGGGQQPGVPIGQQIHAGAGGPGAPQANQTGPLMGGLMQAGGPPGAPGNGVASAHALSQAHLTPGHPTYQQQQQHQQMQSACESPIFDTLCNMFLRRE